MKKITLALPWILVAVFAAGIAASLRLPSQPGFHTRDFGELPVVLGGRVQPLDSVARNSLLQLRTKQTVLLENRASLPALDWLMEMLMNPQAADTRKVFRIDNGEVLSLLKLPAEEKYFSYAQLKPWLPEIEKQADRLSPIEDKVRSTFERQLMKLAAGLNLYHRLQNSLQPEDARDFAGDLTAYGSEVQAGVAALQAQRDGNPFDQALFSRIMPQLKNFEFMSRVAYPLMVPPANPAQSRDGWQNVGASLLGLATGRAAEVHPAITSYAAMSVAFARGNVPGFNRALAQYQLWLQEKGLTRELRKGRFEFFFNHFQPFYQASLVYVMALLLAFVFWANQAQWCRRSGYFLVVLGFVVHTLGLGCRMALEGRPPVTNLYSAAVFVGWGSVLLGLILERFYRDGIGIVTGSVIGFATLIVAHHLALGGDTMEMLVAVLDTNFWLATHVVTIAIGYSSCFVAGILAIIYILRGVFTRSLTPALAQTLQRMVYGVVCFATLFSFVGTVLGGIWADQSWGRFWGWDPKENGALLIVLWNAAFLHVRWGGILKDRGLMNMAVFGSIITSYSFFGVNMLGVGLHTYGFMDAAFKWLMAFIALHLLIIACGTLPKQYWRSFRSPAKDLSDEALLAKEQPAPLSP
jgi:ABC-type transport system involved in cytochrome c biogenesis permease subunit